MTFAVPRSIPIFMTTGMLLRGPRRASVDRGAEGVGKRTGGASGGVRGTDDARAQLLELAVDVLIPALNVMGAMDERGAVRGQCGEDERGARAQVADRRLGAVKLGRAVDPRVVGILDVDARAQPAQL